MTLVLGMFEIGMAWSSSQSVVQASRSGARTVSQMGTYAYADQEALRAVLSTFGDDLDQVRRVSVYRYDAGQPDGVPATCDITGGGAFCNSYGPTDFAQVGNASHFAVSDTSCGSRASGSWCPVGGLRIDSQSNATLVGVEVEFAHKPVSGFFGSSDRILTQRIVMKIEPRTS